jgi:tripartite-type tricarboxylate transporter receptor subunit TctC
MTLPNNLRAAAAALGAALCLSPAMAQDSEKAFFAGKVIRLVVGFGPGGGYDAYARMMAPYLASALGNVAVVVENHLGAGGLVALNRVYAAAPDGLTMMIVSGNGAALSQLTDQPGARYDLAKFGYLATVSASPWMWLVGPDTVLRTPEAAINAKMKWRWAASGPADGLSDGAAFTCEALKLDCHVVLGYKGSADAALAVTRGEMDALYVSDTSANNYVLGKQNLPIAAMGRKKSRFFPNTPTIHESVKLDADAQWLFDFHNAVTDLGRIMVTSPGVPAARLKYLQEAYRQMLNDPQLRAEGEKSQRYVDYVDAEATRRNALTVVSDVTPEQKKRVQSILAKAR